MLTWRRMKPAKVYNVLAVTAAATGQSKHGRGSAGSRLPRCQETPA